MTQSARVIKKITKCWNVNGLYNQFCQVELDNGHSGLVAVSKNIKQPESLEEWIEINCDPEEEVCPIPDYVFKRYQRKK